MSASSRPIALLACCPRLCNALLGYARRRATPFDPISTLAWQAHAARSPLRHNHPPEQQIARVLARPVRLFARPDIRDDRWPGREFSSPKPVLPPRFFLVVRPSRVCDPPHRQPLRARARQPASDAGVHRFTRAHRMRPPPRVGGACWNPMARRKLPEGLSRLLPVTQTSPVALASAGARMGMLVAQHSAAAQSHGHQPPLGPWRACRGSGPSAAAASSRPFPPACTALFSVS